MITFTLRFSFPSTRLWRAAGDSLTLPCGGVGDRRSTSRMIVRRLVFLIQLFLFSYVSSLSSQPAFSLKPSPAFLHTASWGGISSLWRSPTMLDGSVFSGVNRGPPVAFFCNGGTHSFDILCVTVFDLFVLQSVFKDVSLCAQGKGLIIIKSSCVLLLLLPAVWRRQYIDSWKRSHCFKFMYTAHTKRSGREDV